MIDTLVARIDAALQCGKVAQAQEPTATRNRGFLSSDWRIAVVSVDTGFVIVWATEGQELS